ncbi:Cell envelope-related transcriptional attenuator [Microbacterium esteraromaticum]|uniref:Cell envelope-related transcriptional attenuator n=1 Tax=Microbacterium esteraromaticum TaxID=57043 RepID=A0A1R4JEP0_9MICO|nr:LCP family protein [Microbacterium esteraromaticum]SJN30404.1 Cell envelope-related transcriptional attenuator [Microbacterium esteraromaticum]
MILAAPRASSERARPLVETKPLRHPDAADPALMGRRAWWLVVWNVLVPGSAQVLAGNRRLGRFGLGATLLGWFLIVVAAGLGLFARGVLVSIFTGALSWIVLTLVQLLLIGYAVLWVVLTIDTVRLVRLVKVPPISRWAVPVASVLVLALIGSGAVYGSTVAASSRGALGTIFGNSGPSLPPSDGYYNILLLGADSGDGRDSMRFDSISVVSVNAASGAVTITGIPRELPHAPFSEGSPMRELYPDGFQGHSSDTCGWNPWMNLVRYAAEVCREDEGASLYPDAAAHGSAPGIEATKDAAEGVLGIEIPYYVFVDMNGFAQLVDALGGVQIEVTERLPKGGGPAYKDQPAADWAIGWIEPGLQHMDGDTAQWYARSRYTTSDWDRMKRQRELQVAILDQFTPENVLARFNELASAGTVLIDTDLPKDKLPEFFDLMLKAKKQKVTQIELTPDNGVSETDPDYGVIHEMVAVALHPPKKETPAE